MPNEHDRPYIYRKSTAPNLADPVRKYWPGPYINNVGLRDKWLIDGIPPDSEAYLINGEQYPGELIMAFGEVLHEQEASGGWQSFIESVRARCGTTHMLDLMGGAYCVPPDTLEQMDSLTGLRLEDISLAYKEKLAGNEQGWKRVLEKHPDHQQFALFASAAKKEHETLEKIEASPNRSCVYGDIWKDDTWRRLRARMDENHIPSFDIIFCRPVGPFVNDNIFPNQMPVDRHLEYEAGFAKLLLKATNLVNIKGGVLLTQIPELFTSESIDRWRRHLDDDTRFTTTICEKHYTGQFGKTRTGHIMRLDFHQDKDDVDGDAQ